MKVKLIRRGASKNVKSGNLRHDDIFVATTLPSLIAQGSALGRQLLDIEASSEVWLASNLVDAGIFGVYDYKVKPDHYDKVRHAFKNDDELVYVDVSRYIKANRSPNTLLDFVTNCNKVTFLYVLGKRRLFVVFNVDTIYHDYIELRNFARKHDVKDQQGRAFESVRPGTLLSCYFDND